MRRWNGWGDDQFNLELPKEGQPTIWHLSANLFQRYIREWNGCLLYTSPSPRD